MREKKGRPERSSLTGKALEKFSSFKAFKRSAKGGRKLWKTRPELSISQILEVQYT